MSKPNILFVCSDQQHWAMNSFSGHPLVKTPSMQSLADRGAQFRCYSNSPVCAPSRAALFTGLYPHEVGVYDNAAPLKPGHRTFGHLAREQGYNCQAFGKLDFHFNADFGFEEHGCSHGHDPSPDITAYTRKPVVPRPANMTVVQENLVDQHDGDRNITAKALHFLNSPDAQNDQPWLCWVGWNAPHDPYRCTKQYMDMYPIDQVDAPQFPDNWQDSEHPAMKQTRIQRCCDTVIPEERHKHDRAAYYAMISEIDDLLGDLIQSLKDTKQFDNTIIIFSSDHGDMMGDHGFYYKNTPYDSSARVPLLIAGPGIKNNEAIHTAVSLVDVYATIAELCGAAVTDTCRGNSLIPLIDGDSSKHPFAYIELNTERLDTGVFSIIKDNWKYNYYADYPAQLFNTEDDPNEWNDRINDPTCEEKVKELKGILFNHVDPDAIHQAAFDDQKRRLIRYLQSDTRNAEEIIKDDVFQQFVKRIGEVAAKSFIENHVASLATD